MKTTESVELNIEIAKRLREFADAIDNEGCKMYCYGKCIDGQCLMRKAADIIQQFINECEENK